MARGAPWFVPAVEGDAFVAGWPGVDFTSGLEAADELADPLGTGGVLATKFGKGRAGLKVGEDAGAEVEGKGTHDRLHPIRGAPILADPALERKTENQNALIG